MTDERTVIVHGRAGIAGAIGDVWGYCPSDSQVKRWLRLPTDPIPAFTDGTDRRPHAVQDQVYEWARRNRRCVSSPSDDAATG